MNTIEFELWEDGTHCPMKKFLESLTEEDGGDVLTKLNRYESYPFTTLLLDKKIRKLKGYMNLYEVRISIRKIAYRFLGTLKGSLLVLVHAFKKKSEHTPQKEINTALIRIATISKK